MEKRPAAVRTLYAAQIGRDPGFKLGFDRLTKVVPKQDIFGRDGRVGFKLENPMPVLLPASQKRFGGGINLRFKALLGSCVRLCGLRFAA